MKKKTLEKLRGELARMRRSPQRAADLESLAKRLGRKKVNRGKEPMWESEEFKLYPLAIPHHGGRDLATGTKNSVLSSLEDDLLAWEERLNEEGGDDDETNEE